LQEIISLYSAEGRNMSLKLHFLYSQLDIFFWKYGSLLRWTLWKIPSRNFPNWKQVPWKMESKYVGWLLLDFYKGDTKWRN
jgi:hypothetical protein